MEALEPRQLLASLSGEVWSDLNANGQRDATEPGAANVRVYVDSVDNGQLDDFERQTTTNVLGQYAFEGLPAGNHVVRLDLGDQQKQTAPRAYYGTGDTTEGPGAPTQLFELSKRFGSGIWDVLPIGSQTAERINGLIRTNAGTLYGISVNTKSIYTIDSETGQETPLTTPDNKFFAGLAHDPATDKIYTVGLQEESEGPTNVSRLFEITPTDTDDDEVVDSVMMTQIGPGLVGLDEITGLTFDTLNNRIIAFDNQDDEFFAIDLEGKITSLSIADPSLNSGSLAFNGESFVMFDQDDPGTVLQVNPDTGATDFAFNASPGLSVESLFYAPSGNIAQRLTLPNEDAIFFNVDFGIFGESDDVPGGGSGPALGGLYINELMIDPLFGNPDTDQYVEIRGDKGAAIPENTYLLVVDDDNDVRGEIHGIFDLSNQVLGTNGFLVLLQQGAPYPVDAGATVLQSEEPGFGGLPGDIYSHSHLQADRIDFVIGPNTFMLIEAPVPPSFEKGIDENENGIADFNEDLDSDGTVDVEDPDSDTYGWKVLDSISLHPDVTSNQANQAYGQIVMAQEGAVVDPLVIPAGAELVVGKGFGYTARVGDSIGSTAADWVMGTVRDEVPGDEVLRYGFEAEIFGIPTQPAFQGRDLDHVGDSNFVGGVRGHVIFGPADSLPPEPAPGVTVFADVNSNGLQDNLLNVVEPDAFPAGTHLINSYPGVTINTADQNNEIVGFNVTSEQQRNGFEILSNRHFAQGSIDFFNESTRLRFDLYRPANTVSIVGIADDFAFTPTYIRLDAFDADDNLLGTVLSDQLISSSTQLLTISFEDNVIAYAVAYSDQTVTDFNGNPIPSSSFGRLDRFSFRQQEASDVTDEEGFYEISYLFPDEYRVTFQNSFFNPPLQGAQPVPIVVTRYENFVLGPNDLPEAMDFETTLPENSGLEGPVIVGVIDGFDTDGPVTYSIEGDSRGIEIDEESGVMFVGDGPEWDLNYESPLGSTIVFQVGVSDVLGATTYVTATVALGDLNEAPVATTEPFRIDEDTAEGIIGQIQAYDPDVGQDQELMFELAVPSTVFEVLSDGIVRLIDSGAIDFEDPEKNRFELFVLIKDNGDPMTETEVTQVIEVVDSNDPPMIIPEPITVPENSTGKIGQIEVTDPDTEQTHQFFLADGDGAGVFNVLSDGSVVVEEGIELDYETKATYTLAVSVVDNGTPPLSDTEWITIELEDINEPPVLSPTYATVPENSAEGTLVAMMTTTDLDLPTPHTVTLLKDEGSGAYFEFDEDVSDDLTVAENAELDFETKPIHELVFAIEIENSSGQSETISTVMTVELTDANDAPQILTESITVSELAEVGDVVGEIRVSDVDENEDLEITVVVEGEPAEDLFAVDESGVVTVIGELDYETQENLKLKVKVTDKDEAMDTQFVNFELIDVNEPPVFGDTLDVPEAFSGTPYSFTIPADFAMDPEGGDFELSVYEKDGELPAWMMFDAETRTLSGMPTPDVLGDYALILQARELGPVELVSTFPFQFRASEGETPLQNKRNPMDVDNNSFVSANDANRVLIDVRLRLLGIVVFVGFTDVNGNNLVTAADALAVINYLAILQARGEAEQVLVFNEDDDRESSVDAALTELAQSFLF